MVVEVRPGKLKIQILITHRDDISKAHEIVRRRAKMLKDRKIFTI